MESIKDRLAHILRAKNLTATQFADKMQIQPSNVSHLLSGRNKPSLDFLMKLKEVFPEYNFDWIILGKKPITTNEPTLFGKENVDDAIELPHNIDDEVAEKEAFQIEMPKIVQVEEAVNGIRGTRDANGLKQIIYVYEDHTFEIYEIRK